MNLSSPFCPNFPMALCVSGYPNHQHRHFKLHRYVCSAMVALDVIHPPVWPGGEESETHMFWGRKYSRSARMNPGNCWDTWDGCAGVLPFVVSWHVGADVPLGSHFQWHVQGHCGRKFHTSFTVGNLWQGMGMHFHVPNNNCCSGSFRNPIVSTPSML